MIKIVLRLFGSFVMLCPLTAVYAQDNDSACTPIGSDNISALTLFFEREGFSDFSLTDLFPDMNIGLDALVWSPDSVNLALSGALFAFEENGTIIHDLQHSPTLFVYSPDGTPLALRGQQDRLEIRDGQAGKQLHRLEVESDYIRDPTLSRDGKLLAFGDGHDQIQLWDMSSGERLYTLEWPGVPVDALAFSPDGTLLASAAYSDPPLLWDVETGTRRYDLSEIGIDNHVEDVAFSPDGSLLAVPTHGQVALVEIATLPTETPDYLREGTVDDVIDVAFSPDGTLLALVGSVRRLSQDYDHIEIWDVSSRTRLYRWESDELMGEVAFSPNGCFLALTNPVTSVEPAQEVLLKLWRVED